MAKRGDSSEDVTKDGDSFEDVAKSGDSFSCLCRRPSVTDLNHV